METVRESRQARIRAIRAMRRLQFAACLAAGFFLLMVGCTCAGETVESDPAAASAPGASGVGSGERPTPAAKLPSLRPPESDIRRSLELFQSSGAEPAALEIPPPPSDLAAAVLETEPNDQKEQATALGSGRFARGSGGDDNDYFSFEVDPPLRRWLLEVSGPTVERAEYFNAAGEKQRLGKVNSRTDAARALSAAPI